MIATCNIIYAYSYVINFIEWLSYDMKVGHVCLLFVWNNSDVW